MNSIVLTIILTTIFAVFSIYYYYKSDSRNKKIFRESISNDVFFTTFIAPLVAAALFSFLISMVFKEGNSEQIYRSDVVILTLMFYLYGVYAASMGIHAIAKVFKPEVTRIKDYKLASLIRFFHGPFSHYTASISFLILVSLLLIFNIKHPAREALAAYEVILITVCGIILGISYAIELAIANMLKFMQLFLPILLLILIYIETHSQEGFIRSPLSVYVFSAIISAMIVLLIDRFGPKKNWFMRFVDRKFVSVNKDWEQIRHHFQFS